MLSGRILFAAAVVVLVCMGSAGSFRAERGRQVDGTASATPDAGSELPVVDAESGATPSEVGEVAADAETAASPWSAGDLIADMATGATPAGMSGRSREPGGHSPSPDAVSGASPSEGNPAIPGAPSPEAPPDAETGASPPLNLPDAGPAPPDGNTGTTHPKPEKDEEADDKDEKALGGEKGNNDGKGGKEKSKKSSLEMTPESLAILMPAFMVAAWALAGRKRRRRQLP
jgi:hypothetical protein